MYFKTWVSFKITPSKNAFQNMGEFLKMLPPKNAFQNMGEFLKLLPKNVFFKTFMLKKYA